MSNFSLRTYTGRVDIEIFAIRRLASGSFAAIDNGRVIAITREPPFGTCENAVEDKTPRYDGWYAESPADYIRECGAPSISPDGPGHCANHMGLHNLSDDEFQEHLDRGPEFDAAAWIV